MLKTIKICVNMTEIVEKKWNSVKISKTFEEQQKSF